MTSPASSEYQRQHPLSMDRGGRAAQWFQANAKVAGVIGAAVLVGVLGTFAWRASERSKAQRGETALYQAQGALATGTDPGQAERALREVATRYAGTSAGTQAQLLLTQSLYDAGRYQEGLNALDRADAPAEFSEAVQLLRASGFEGLGRGAEAARIYEKLAGAAGISARRRDELLASGARAYAIGNDRASALRLWRRILTGGTGALVDEARVRVGELTAAAG